ncbi:autorepressor SdpR family transcription factor [Spirosoma spitsbergense]|uniref:autorepressor SdpR family transcription factor n=1 Tax=Spirosoma spitsbergense TaxID=431554 RepID=UPI0005A7FFEE|nr:autorepressor SdpR family transcription factor [Spirosoma spitsbergense]
MQTTNSVFKALSDETRRKILDMLASGPMPAGKIADAFTMAKPSISHHLNLLKEAGLVYSKKKGQYVYYELNSKSIAEVATWIQYLQSASIP